MKKMLAAALAASMVMGLTACGGSQTADTKAPESAKEADSTAAGESTETAGSDAQKTGSEMTWKLATDAAKDYPNHKRLWSSLLMKFMRRATDVLPLTYMNLLSWVMKFLIWNSFRQEPLM